MLLFLQVTENPYKDIEEIRKHYEIIYDDLHETDPSYGWNEFVKDDYYDENEFIFDTESGKCYDANEFFHKVMNSDK